MLSLDSGLDRNGVPIVSAAALDKHAENIIDDYKSGLLKTPQHINIELFAEQYAKANLRICPIVIDRSILGMTIFNEGIVPVYERGLGMIGIRVPKRTILVEEGLINPIKPGRFNFTVAHEAAGHLLCHDKVNLPTGFICRQEKSGCMFTCYHADFPEWKRSVRTPEQWLEWQADYMAGAILMPAKTVRMAIDRILWNFGVLSDDCSMRELCTNQILFRRVACELSIIYQVSQTAAGIRMTHLLT